MIYNKVNLLKFFADISVRKSIILLIITGFIVYFNSLFNAFVWDDYRQIVNNEPVQSLKNLPQFFRGSTIYYNDNNKLEGIYYKPLLTTYYSALFSFFNDQPFFFHLAQVSLHLINAILVFLILNYFIKNRTIVFGLSVIFLVHPINVESVSYIAGAQEPLFFLFGASALYIIMRHFQGLITLFVIFLLLLLSLLSKESGLLFVLISGIYLGLYRRKNIFSYGILALTALLFYAILRFLLAKVSFSADAGSPIAMLTFTERLVNIPLILFTYLKTFFLPKDLIISHYWVVREINFANFYLPLSLVILFFLLIFYLSSRLLKKSKEDFISFIFFLSWLVAGLSFHLQLFPLDLTYSDRWFYFPMVGILGIIGIFASKIKIDNEKTKAALIVLTLALILGFSVRTVVRNSNWQDNLTIFAHDSKIKKYPASAEWNLGLEWNLGTAYLENKKYDEAINYFQTLAASPDPSWSQSYYLGLFYEQKGDPVLAGKNLLRAIELTDENKRGQIHLPFEKYAILLLHYGSPEKTKEFSQEALKQFPDNPKLWLTLSLAFYKQKNYPQAIVAARKAYNLLPDEETEYVVSQLEAGSSIDL